jgi:hypothetical protein
MKRTLPTGADFSAAIDQMKAFAAQSGAALLSEGAVHPDHTLLALCAEAHDLHATEQAIWRKARELVNATIHNPEYAAMMDERDKFQNRRRSVLTRIGKLKSATPAGIYSKALLVRDRYCTAQQIAKSMAEDLIALPGLRASLWPAGEG